MEGGVGGEGFVFVVQRLGCEKLLPAYLCVSYVYYTQWRTREMGCLKKAEPDVRWSGYREGDGGGMGRRGCGASLGRGWKQGGALEPSETSENGE